MNSSISLQPSTSAGQESDINWSLADDAPNNPESPVGALFLRRLRRLLAARIYSARHLNADCDRLLDRAIYSTYCDLRAMGLTEAARPYLSELRSVLGGGLPD